MSAIQYVLFFIFFGQAHGFLRLIPANITLYGDVAATLSTDDVRDCVTLVGPDTVFLRYEVPQRLCTIYNSITGYVIRQDPTIFCRMFYMQENSDETSCMTTSETLDAIDKVIMVSTSTEAPSCMDQWAAAVRYDGDDTYFLVSIREVVDRSTYDSVTNILRDSESTEEAANTLCTSFQTRISQNTLIKTGDDSSTFSSLCSCLEDYD